MRAYTTRRLLFLAAPAFLVLPSLSCGGDQGAPTPTPNSVLVTPGADTLVAIGATRTFTAQVLDANGDPIDGKVITWGSSAPGVLSVDPATGVATAVANGSAQVTATSGTLHGSANAVVFQVVASVSVTPGNASLTAVGDTVRFTAVPKDSLGNPVANAQVLWSVNDNTVATIDTLGLAKAKGPGTVLVSAQAQARAGYAALGVTQAVASVAITSAPASGTAGQPFASAVQVEVRDSNGSRVHNASLPVTIGVVGGDGPGGMIGIKTLTTIDGAASFQNLGATRAGSIQLTATAPGVTAGTSGAVTEAAAPPAKLKILSFKDTLTAGDTLQASIALLDTYDNQTTVDGISVGVKLRRDFHGGTDDQGLTFALDPHSTGGIIDQFGAQAIVADTAWTLVVTSPTFDSVVAGPIVVEPGAASHTAMFFGIYYLQQQFIGVGAPHSTGLEADVTDAYGNTVPSAPATGLTATLMSWQYGTPGDPQLTQQIGGTTAGTTSAGVLSLPSVALRRPGITTLRAVGGGLVPFDLEVEGRLLNKHGIAVGGRHACLLSDGGAYCWGDNASGQLTGQGTVDSVARPIQGAPTLVSLVAGDAHTCGLTSAGVAWCWGKNSSGQLGRSTTTASEPVPAAVVTGVTFSSLTAGGDHTCGVAVADSTAWCWGSNASNEIGDSTTTARNVPTLVAGGHKFLQLSAGGDHTCGVAIGTSGAAYCWGNNTDGQGGTGSASPTALTTPALVAIDSVVTIAAGSNFTCAEIRVSSGDLTAWCWGQTDLGHLGNAANFISAHPTPVQVPGIGAVVQGGITAGADNACAISASYGSYFCWGDNGYQQITAAGGIIAGTSPAYGVNGTPGNTGVGNSFICYIGSTNPGTPADTYCLGVNAQGQNGSGSTAIPFVYGKRAIQ